MLAEAGFAAVTEMLDEEGVCRGVGLFTVLAPGRMLRAACGLVEEVFVGVVGVGGIDVEHTTGGQVQVELAQSGYVRFAAGVDMVGHGQPVTGSDSLDFDAIEPTVLAGETNGLVLESQWLAT